MDIIQTTQVHGVSLKSNLGKKARGSLYVTTTHLIFVDPDGVKETWILHSHISNIEKLPLNTSGAPLRIRCKTFQDVTIVVPKEKECHDVYSALLHFSNPEKIEDLYAFTYSPQTEKLTKTAGWALFDIKSEYARMGLPSDLWTSTSMNNDYKLCDTYPNTLFVPTSATEETIYGSSKFRSRGRLPVLSFYHKSTKAAICRCSQPLGGFKGRCPEDESMIQAILKSNPESKFLYIVDTRPKINAMANRAAGKGYESEDFYDNVKFQFVGIENIHVMRQSLYKMLEVVNDSPKLSFGAFINGLEASNWLKHIKSVMDTSVFIAKAIILEKASVLVHCSDGWDRTAQTCSLASIILDPYYRTIHGFQVLIEKEWLSFGHKFTDRCGLLQSDQKEFSPVFLQFLESIWQLLEQFPFCFQFNERFLLTLHDHVHSCQFGTFLGNCERERKELELSKRTYSLWGYMWQNISDYANPLYREADDILWPDTSPQSIKFWRAMYNRFDNDIHPRESLMDSLSSIIDHNDSLQDHIKLLEKRIELLKKIKTHKSTSVTNGPATSSTNSPTLESVEPNTDSMNALSINSDVTPSKEEETKEGAKQVNSEALPPEITTALKRQGMQLKDLLTDVPSLAVQWKSVRDVSQCSSCAAPIAFLDRKYHCWNCGEVFCRRCIDRQCSLPAHYSENRVPVCKKCYKQIQG
ncbi:myotubularin-related protein 6-like [Actinia tenebrosa]|uniref:phosphatidylinositol-3,5-bisphosphate 3-phosphatase n=1 Tax=Actinia tenebrosa TaxID=6105 RepID=A0A6P8HBJ7_ACTTE|nr:myotubularin-related protein 6-like [Actinia tenebrosa]